ncbi:MAG: HXXEE domain-containing protein [Patescibacteria group bacterium]
MFIKKRFQACSHIMHKIVDKLKTCRLNLNKLIAIQFLNFSHFIDEYFFGFPEWATRHFGTTSKNYYLLSHAMIILFIGVMMWGIKKGSKTAIFLALAVQTVFFTNGIFHIITTFLFSEYSPGLLSQLIIFPASIITYKMVRESKVLSVREVAHSLVLGTTISVLIILSLWLNMAW